VIERRTQQDSPTNYGRIYIKCTRNEKWVSLTLVFQFRLFDLAKIDLYKFQKSELVRCATVAINFVK
jgi:hypothetical protein